MIEIPKQLQKEEFRFILLEKNSKKPIEKDWVEKNNYKFNDKKLLDWIKSEKNYGVLLGPGNLFVIDIDVKNAKAVDFEKFKALDTFQILTGGGGLHLYFISEESELFENETLSIGELKMKGVQVVGPTSNYTNGITKYKISKDLEIFKIGSGKFKGFYNEFISMHKIKKEMQDDQNLEIGEHPGDTSRSGLDFNNLRHLIKNGLSEEEIFSQMIKSSVRWSSLPKSKQKWEYDNAKKSIEKFAVKDSFANNQYYNQFKEDKTNAALPERHTYSAKSLMSETIDEPEYLLQKLIPKGKMILIGAKAGRFKTGFALNLILSMANVKLENVQNTLDSSIKPIPQEFLGKFKSGNIPKKILYYDLDMNGKKSLQRKIKYFMQGMHYNPEILNRIDFEETFYSKNLEKELEIIQPYDVIILDSYVRFVQGDENETRAAKDFFEKFLKILKQNDKTVIVLHHFKKEKIESVEDNDLIDAFRGSTEIVAQFDICYAMTKTSDKENEYDKTTTFDVYVVNAKDREDLATKKISFRVLKNDNTMQTKLEYLGDDKPIELFDTKEKCILEFLQNKDWVSRKEILQSIRKQIEISPKTIDRTLKDLVDLDELEISNGKYRRNISKNDSV